VRNPASAVAEVRRELGRSPELRYAHRLDGVLLVAQGMPYRSAAAWMGDAPRTLAYWVHRYERRGLEGLREQPPPGRARRLSAPQLTEVADVVRRPPTAAGMSGTRWSGPSLAAWIENQFAVHVSVRHARRILQECGVSRARGLG
jgi:transposase